MFCGNDEMAMQVYNAATRLGLSVPGDVSVVGFDDHRVFSEGLMPPLTTVALPYDRIGRIAADLLIEQISGRRSAEIIRIQGPLIVRESTAQVRAAWSRSNAGHQGLRQDSLAEPHRLERVPERRGTFIDAALQRVDELAVLVEEATKD